MLRRGFFASVAGTLAGLFGLGGKARASAPECIVGRIYRDATRPVEFEYRLVLEDMHLPDANRVMRAGNLGWNRSTVGPWISEGVDLDRGLREYYKLCPTLREVGGTMRLVRRTVRTVEVVQWCRYPDGPGPVLDLTATPVA